MPSCSSDNGQEPHFNEKEDVLTSDDSENQNEIIEHCLKHEFITDNFNLEKKIGGGGCGFVYKALHKFDKPEYALKFVPIYSLDIPKRENRSFGHA